VRWRVVAAELHPDWLTRRQHLGRGRGRLGGKKGEVMKQHSPAGLAGLLSIPGEGEAGLGMGEGGCCLPHH
jgi:hypothetical protein